MSKTLFRSLLATAVLIIASSPAAFCQLNSNTATISLSATLGESLSISATPTATSFALVAGGTAQASAPVAITQTWVLNASRASVTLVGWFANAAQALTSGGSSPVYIPTSEVLGQVTTGSPTAFTAFTATPGTGQPGVTGASLVLTTTAITNANRNSSRTDNLNLEINLTSQPQLPAGTYTGTLNLQAQAL
ncbi:MAG: hypothetical protein JOZ33_13510 [Acidobacteriaceae bacterium]|nr:hypothetical protein [Acidobacteriaceae bacterium]